MKTEQQEALRKPFPRESVGLLPRALKKDSPKSKCEKCGGYHGFPAIHLDYVGHAAVTARLLDADPCWSWEPVAFGEDGLPKFDGFGGLWGPVSMGQGGGWASAAHQPNHCDDQCHRCSWARQFYHD